MNRTRRTFVAALAVAAGCNVSPQATPAVPCSAHICAVSIQNHSVSDLAVRYADTTGHADLMGRVPGASLRVFRIQWVRSAKIRVSATTTRGDEFVANVALQRARTTEIQFPDDFVSIEDLRSSPGLPPHR